MIEQKSREAQYLEDKLNMMGSLAYFTVTDANPGFRVDVRLWASRSEKLRPIGGGIAVVVRDPEKIPDDTVARFVAACATALARWILSPNTGVVSIEG